MLGRLTIPEGDLTLSGVESVVSIKKAVDIGFASMSSIGNCYKLALDEWHPVSQGPDPKLKQDFSSSLPKLKSSFRVPRRIRGTSLIQRDLQQHNSGIQDLSSRDAKLLDSLTNGVASTPKARSASDNSAGRSDSAACTTPAGSLRALTAKHNI